MIDDAESTGALDNLDAAGQIDLIRVVRQAAASENSVEPAKEEAPKDQTISETKKETKQSDVDELSFDSEEDENRNKR